MPKSISRMKGSQGGFVEVKRAYLNDPQSADDIKIFASTDDINAEQVSAWKFTVQYESQLNTTMVFRLGRFVNNSFINFNSDTYTRFTGVGQDTGGGQLFYGGNAYEQSSNGYVGTTLTADAFDQVRWEIVIFGSTTQNNTPVGGYFMVTTQSSANDYLQIKGDFIGAATYNRFTIHGVDFSPYVNYVYVNDLQYKVEAQLGEGDI